MATTEDREGTDATDEWRRGLYEQKPERDALFTTISGLENEPLYTLTTSSSTTARPRLSGVCPTRARSIPPCTGAGFGRCGSSRGFGTAEETNTRFRYLLEHGRTGLSTAFDMPT